MKYLRILENLNTRDKCQKCSTEPQTPVGTYLAHAPSRRTALHMTQKASGQRLGRTIKFFPWETGIWEAESVGILLELNVDFGTECGIWGQRRVGHVQKN